MALGVSDPGHAGDAHGPGEDGQASRAGDSWALETPCSAGASMIDMLVFDLWPESRDGNFSVIGRELAAI
jgi:hypothetical protein